MDRTAWWATVHGVAKSQTQLSDLACTHMVRLRRPKRSSLAKDRLQKKQSKRFRSVGEAPQFSDAAELKFLALREGNGTPLQYSGLENPMGGGAWWAAICGVAQSRTRLR